jgi:hypothetical protein
MERLSASTVLFSCSNSRSTDVIELSRNALLDNALGASRVLSSGTGPGEQAGYAIFIFLDIGPGRRGIGTTAAGGPSFCRISVIGNSLADPGTAFFIISVSLSLSCSVAGSGRRAVAFRKPFD